MIQYKPSLLIPCYYQTSDRPIYGLPAHLCLKLLYWSGCKKTLIPFFYFLVQLDCCCILTFDLGCNFLFVFLQVCLSWFLSQIVQALFHLFLNKTKVISLLCLPRGGIINYFNQNNDLMMAFVGILMYRVAISNFL